MIKLRISALTDVGRAREHNEDNFIVCPDLQTKEWFLVDKPFQSSSAGALLVVADGMGGANAGEIASEIAVDNVKKFFLSQDFNQTYSEKQVKDLLKESIHVAHKAIVDHADAHPACEGMGTTIVIAWILPDKVVLAWCGDSRAYLYNAEEGIKILTKDHSLVWELVEAGKLTPQEADVHPDSNIITQSLGDPKHAPKPDVIVYPLSQSDKIMLCSDGLNNMVDIDEISQILSAGKSLPEINNDLIQAANRHGGKDNITVVLLEMLSQGAMADDNKKKSVDKSSLIILSLIAIVALSAALWFLMNRKTAEQSISHSSEEDKKELLAQTSATKPVSVVKADNRNPTEVAIKVADTEKPKTTDKEKEKSIRKEKLAEPEKDSIQVQPSNVSPKEVVAENEKTSMPLKEENIFNRISGLLEKWKELEDKIKNTNNIHKTDSEQSGNFGFLSIEPSRKKINAIIEENEFEMIIKQGPDNREQSTSNAGEKELLEKLNKAEELYEDIKANFDKINNSNSANN